MQGLFGKILRYGGKKEIKKYFIQKSSAHLLQ